jgi:hypothetical protein
MKRELFAAERWKVRSPPANYFKFAVEGLRMDGMADLRRI